MGVVGTRSCAIRRCTSGNLLLLIAPRSPLFLVSFFGACSRFTGVRCRIARERGPYQLLQSSASSNSSSSSNSFEAGNQPVDLSPPAFSDANHLYRGDSRTRTIEELTPTRRFADTPIRVPYTLHTVFPPTIVRTARPLSSHPSNGVLRECENECSFR